METIEEVNREDQQAVEAQVVGLGEDFVFGQDLNAGTDKAEQGSAGQPVTASESKPEGNSKGDAFLFQIAMLDGAWEKDRSGDIDNPLHKIALFRSIDRD